MKRNGTTGVTDREEWRARILRALEELRGDDARIQAPPGAGSDADGAQTSKTE